MPAIAGAATAAAGVAWGAYKYNRMNYLYDQGLRYSRYVAGYSMAIEQAAQYREDIRDLTAITVSKQDLYHIVGVIFYVITFQLIMAGRLGVHGPVPPGWVIGIHYTCGGLAMLFLTLSTWLAMHASARAQSGMAHMLTRNVRLPIPTPAQLDKARMFGNSYEHTRATDMFRVPFVMPAGHAHDPFAEEEGKLGKGKKGGKSAEPEKQRRMPKWYRDESAVLYRGAEGASPTTPEHFELYRGLQQEWWCHDIYARIALTYYMSHWLHGASFYVQCHAFGELRAIWVAWTATLPLVAAHIGLLKVEILSEATKDHAYHFPVEHIAPLTPLLTCLGMSFEYSIIEPSNGLKAFIYVIAWTCYVIHFLWALRLFLLAVPVSMVEKADLPSQPWWPAEWWLPPAFQHAVYLVAAPKKVDDDQTCLQQEMRAAKGGKASSAASTGVRYKARESLPGLYPWRIMRGGLITMIAMWVFMIFGRVVEQLHGERKLLKQEGRVTRWPSHMQPWMPPWTRQDGLGNPRRDEWCHTGGCDRRLGSSQQSKDEQIAAVAQKLSSVLAAVSETLDHEFGAPPVAPKTSAPLRQAKVAWPAQLSPTLVACGDGGMAALAHDGRVGATMRLPQPQHIHANEIDAAPSPFSLMGIDGLGDILGASWSHSGLLLTTRSGSLAECRGKPPASLSTPWVCSEVGARLPTGGSAVKWAAAGRMVQTGRLRAAVVFEEDEAFTLFEEMADGSGGWEPAGEVRLPLRPLDATASLSFSMSPDADELLITSSHDGHVIRMSLSSTASDVAAAPHISTTTNDLVWRGTCRLDGGQLAHLASRTNAGGEASSAPELFFSARA